MSVVEVIYTTSYRPDPSDAREVLAFVLLRPEAWSDDPVEQVAINAILEPAKRAAIDRWRQSGGRT